MTTIRREADLELRLRPVIALYGADVRQKSPAHAVGWTSSLWR
jgi:hypothetical protein